MHLTTLILPELGCKGIHVQFGWLCNLGDALDATACPVGSLAQMLLPSTVTVRQQAHLHVLLSKGHDP
jgi:hypothetical protein